MRMLLRMEFPSKGSRICICGAFFESLDKFLHLKLDYRGLKVVSRRGENVLDEVQCY